jgi:hypothetical protein
MSHCFLSYNCKQFALHGIIVLLCRLLRDHNPAHSSLAEKIMLFAIAGLFALNLSLSAQALVPLHEGKRDAGVGSPACLGKITKNWHCKNYWILKSVHH